MQWLRDGGEVGPTDKSYKAYIKCPYSDPRAGETAEIDRGISVYGITAKFYFQHLSEVQQHEFIRLYNAKQMNVGCPGHFYVLPYFCGRVAQQSEN